MKKVLAPTRSNLRSSNPDEIRDLLGRMYGWALTVEEMQRERLEMAVSQATVGGVSWVDLDIPATMRTQAESRDAYTFNLIKSGVSERRDAGLSFGRGSVYLGSAPDIEETAVMSHVVARAVRLPGPMLRQSASDDPERPFDDLRFLSRRPVGRGAERWKAACNTFEVLIADPERASAPLVMGPAIRLLAAVTLDAFPTNATPRDPAPVASGDLAPTTVQRAIAFIEANPELDIAVPDIARASFVTVRALQQAFRRQLDTTPLAYLRQVRLSHARRDLQQATTVAGTTVSRVALKWGFSSPTRFSQQYREAYGESPRDTLGR